MDLLKHLVELIPSQGSGGVLAIGVILELVLRLVPSDKPKSILLAVDAGLKAIGDGCIKLAALLDSVIPQKLK